jgi:hypothetical protein
MGAYELLWSRIATYSAITGKRYAAMSRTAWGERTVTPFMGTNDVDFKGWIVGENYKYDPSQDNLVTIGFFHPLFAGVVGRGAIVEVIDNFSDLAPCKYIAVGCGMERLVAGPRCIDAVPTLNPCDPIVCEGGYEWIWGSAFPPGDPMGMSFWDIFGGGIPGVNQFPSDFRLLGYEGQRQLPLTNRGMIVDWIPGQSAFMLDFQPCPCIQSSDSGLHGPEDGTHFCCWLLWAVRGELGDYLEQLYTEEEVMELCADYWAGLGGGLGNPPPPPEPEPDPGPPPVGDPPPLGL